jgi:hypothetical protein
LSKLPPHCAVYGANKFIKAKFIGNGDITLCGNIDVAVESFVAIGIDISVGDGCSLLK